MQRHPELALRVRGIFEAPKRTKTGRSLFLEQYKLESNPFVADAARPVFASHSMRYASLKLEELVNKQIHCLFLSGAPGVGTQSAAPPPSGRSRCR